MAHSTLPCHRQAASPSPSPSPRPPGAALVRLAAVAVALVLVVALAIVLFLGWSAGDAPDLYTRATIYRPIGPAAAGTGSATVPLLEIWPAQ